MAGIEAGIGIATMAGPTLNTAPSFAAPAIGEMHIGEPLFAPLGDIPLAPQGELANVSSLDGFAPFDPGMASDMLGFEGRATPFDTPSVDIFTQVADVAAKAWETPGVIREAEQIAQAAWEKPSFDVQSQAEDLARTAENTFLKDQAQQIALYTALYSVPVTASEAAIQEIMGPISTPEVITAPSVTRVETQAEQVVEAVAREIVTEYRSPEEIGREADVALAGEVEALARELNLTDLADRLAVERTETIAQQEVTVEPQSEEIVEGEVLGSPATESSAQRISMTSPYVEEVASRQVLPEGEEQTVAEEQVAHEDAATQQDTAKKAGGVLVDDGPMRAVETNERRRGIASEVVEEAKENLDTKGEISGADLAREFRERANAHALSPILNGQGPDGSVDYIVAPLEGQTYEDIDTASSVLQRGVSAYTAVTTGNRKDASPDDVARVYGGSRRGVLAAA